MVKQSWIILCSVKSLFPFCQIRSKQQPHLTCGTVLTGELGLANTHSKKFVAVHDENNAVFSSLSPHRDFARTGGVSDVPVHLGVAIGKFGLL